MRGNVKVLQALLKGVYEMHVTPLYWYVNAAAAPQRASAAALVPLIPSSNTRQPVLGLPHGKSPSRHSPSRERPEEGSSSSRHKDPLPKPKLFLTEEIAA